MNSTVTRPPTHSETLFNGNDTSQEVRLLQQLAAFTVPNMPKARRMPLDAINGNRRVSNPPPAVKSRLREALTRPLEPQASIEPLASDSYTRCHLCGSELTSKCLMQACLRPSNAPSEVEQVSCRRCGGELTARCLLASCR